MKRTQVIDDESDYFTTNNKWLSEQEKLALKKREDELRAQRHGSRLDRKITLDIAGRKVVEDNQAIDVYSRDDDVVQAVHFGKNKGREDTNRPAFTDEDFVDLINPNIVQQPPQVYLYGC